MDELIYIAVILGVADLILLGYIFLRFLDLKDKHNKLRDFHFSEMAHIRKEKIDNVYAHSSLEQRLRIAENALNQSRSMSDKVHEMNVRLDVIQAFVEAIQGKKKPRSKKCKKKKKKC
jgi:hypothetical protein